MNEYEYNKRILHSVTQCYYTFRMSKQKYIKSSITIHMNRNTRNNIPHQYLSIDI